MANVRCRSVRGHLTNKSTAFSPDSANFGTQSMIHNHMMVHYKRIENAKSSIDNKPPKGMDKFIKVHAKRVHKKKESERKAHQDELRRSQTSTPVEKNNREVPFLKTSTSLGFYYDDEYDDKHFLDSQRQFRELEFQHQQDEKLESFSRARSSLPISYKALSNIPIKKPMTARHKIEMYETEETEPFEIKGSLFQSMSSSNNNNNNNNNNNFRNTNSKAQYDSSRTQYDNPKKNHDKSRTSYIDTDAWSNGIVSYKQPNCASSVPLDFCMLSLDEQLNHTQTIRKYENKTLPLYESKRLQKQEELIVEEQMYLQFIEEVTSDVLTRGIFSDRVLNQVFDVHIERRKGHLNEGRMRAMIEELKEDLNVKDNATTVRASVSVDKASEDVHRVTTDECDT